MINKFKVMAIQILFIVLIVSFLFTACSTKEENNENGKFYTDKYVNNLINEVNSCHNMDGGFTELVTNVNSEIDLYSTYYANEINTLCDGTSKSNITKILDKFIENDDILLFNENNTDNLSNIYYLCKIAQSNNISIKNYDYDKIKNYIISLQCNNCSFAFSNKHKLSIENNDSTLHKETFLSTFMALYVLNYINAEDYNKITLQKWISSNLRDIHIFDDIHEAGYLLSLIRVGKLCNFDMEPYKSVLEDLVDDYDKKFNKNIHNNELDILTLDEIVNINIEIENNIEKDIDLNKINSMINDLQKSNGWFGINNISEANILPTFISLNYKHIYKFEIFHKENILSYLDKFRQNDEGYVASFNVKSSISTTYYAQQICELLEKKEVDINKYLDNIKDPKNLSFLDRYYYYCMKINNKSENADLVNNLGNIIEEEIGNSSLKSANDYIKLYYNILLLNKIDYKINKDLKDKILNLLNNAPEITNNNKGKNLQNVFDILILNSLEINLDNYKTKLKDVRKNLNNYLQNEKDFNVIEVYYYLYACDVSGEINNVNKDQLQKLLKKCINNDGTFRQCINIESSSSLINTYYSILILKIMNLL